MSKFLNMFILFLALFNLSISTDDPPTPHEELTCGEENSPEDPEDCTKYGTGSGMVCCWISSSKNSKGRCRLVPDSTARQYGISGTKTFTATTSNDKYWDCGNDASFLLSKFAYLVLFLILL